MIVVVGGGPAGRYAAMRLAGAGKEVILAERRPEGLGGQCLHQGCMVICALNDVARTCEHLEGLCSAGIVNSVPKVDFSLLINRMQEIIGTIAKVIDTETQQTGVKVVRGEANVEGRNVLINGEIIEAQSVIIATGSRPVNPQIEGNHLTGVYTAHTILGLQELPRHLIIIGAGAIATELAYIFSVFGSHVTIIARSSLLRNFPTQLIREARRDLHRVDIIEQATVNKIGGEGSVSFVEVSTSAGLQMMKADAVLFAAGMEPETSHISGIVLNDDGFISVSPRMETNIPRVYAVGDVTGEAWLTPIARRQGRIAAEVILGIEPPAPLITVPQAIKLRNDLAFCGETGESQLAVTIPSPAGPGSFWAIPDRATGRNAMMVDPDSGLIRGMLEASPYASVVAAYHALLINNGASIHQMERFIEVHPSADGSGWTGKYLADKFLKK